MNYKLIEIDFDNQSVLVNADDVELWIDYREEESDDEYIKSYSWDFNKYIFFLDNANDVKIQAMQNKIYDDVENFDCFMDYVFEEIEGRG